MTWDPSKNRGWRREAVPRIVELCQKYSTWDGQYANHVEEIVEFTVARIEGCMGMMKSTDCIVYFDQVALFNVTVTNPERVERAEKGYPQLREILEKDHGYDSVPVVLRKVGGQFAVWDGHHRLRTYYQANRPVIPAIVAWFVPGTGKVRVIDRVIPARVATDGESDRGMGSPEPASSPPDD